MTRNRQKINWRTRKTRLMYWQDLSKNIFKLNFHLISVPQEFLWSEWGTPSEPCGLGEQKRTTMCGALRRRLPLIEDSGEPPVYWPSCLTDKFNEVEERLSESTGTLEDCMFNCKDDCRLAWPLFWTTVMHTTNRPIYFSWDNWLIIKWLFLWILIDFFKQKLLIYCF